MENETTNFIYISISVFVSTGYCYTVGRVVSKGTARLLCLLPIVCFFSYLPLHFHTINLSGLTGFLIAWLTNFKILLFAFGKGPLSSDPSISLGSFLVVACFPIRIQQKSSSNLHDQEIKDSKTFKNYAIKGLLFAILVNVPHYSDYIHPKIISFLYFLLLYVELETLFAVTASLARGFLGLELEPPFNEPYLSTSLQDFWGRRWNLIVSSILRPAVYEPIRSLASLVVGRKWALIPAFLGTFLVSGLMHELIFYYMGREKTTWQLTCFFLLHGVCVVFEIALKKKFGGRWPLPRLISGALTMGFILLTGFWLFLPSLYRCKAFERGSAELGALFTFLENRSKHLGNYVVHILSIIIKTRV